MENNQLFELQNNDLEVNKRFRHHVLTVVGNVSDACSCSTSGARGARGARGERGVWCVWREER